MGRKKNFEREDVLEKSLNVFMKKGFADTSVQDLEKATGVNKSGLYSEFKDKEDLFASALKQYIGRVPLQDLFSQEPLGWGNIEKFLKLVFVCGDSRGCFAVNSIRESKIIPAQAKAALSGHLTGLKEMLVQNLKGHTKAKPEIVAEMIIAFHNGNALEQNLQTSDSLKERVELFLQTIKKM
jgi:TetR/AcrR family transcriptional regulator, copper-responsive repressor